MYSHQGFQNRSDQWYRLAAEPIRIGLFNRFGTELRTLTHTTFFIEIQIEQINYATKVDEGQIN